MWTLSSWWFWQIRDDFDVEIIYVSQSSFDKGDEKCHILPSSRRYRSTPHPTASGSASAAEGRAAAGSRHGRPYPHRSSSSRGARDRIRHTWRGGSGLGRNSRPADAETDWPVEWPSRCAAYSGRRSATGALAPQQPRAHLQVMDKLCIVTNFRGRGVTHNYHFSTDHHRRLEVTNSTLDETIAQASRAKLLARSYRRSSRLLASQWVNFSKLILVFPDKFLISRISNICSTSFSTGFPFPTGLLLRTRSYFSCSLRGALRFI